MKKKFYILGLGYKSSDLKKNHPYEVWLDLQEKQYPIVMLEGKSMGGVGGNFKPSEILQEHWEEHIELSNTNWLIALLKNAVNNGDILDYDLVVDTYKYQFNKTPPIKEV